MTIDEPQPFEPPDLPASPVPIEAAEPAAWTMPATPDEMGARITAMQPKINYHLSRYGLGADPLAVGQAKLLAVKAVKSYNPTSGASFNTWLDRSMQPLSRFKRQRASTIKVPERMQLENFTLKRAEMDFEDREGRMPDLEELADEAGTTLERIQAIRKAIRPVAAEGAFEGNLTGVNEPDTMDEAMSAVWRESDKTERLILEMKTGFGGRYQPMAPKEISRILNIHPVDLSRRSSRLGAKIDEMLELIEQ